MSAAVSSFLVAACGLSVAGLERRKWVLGFEFQGLGGRLLGSGIQGSGGLKVRVEGLRVPGARGVPRLTSQRDSSIYGTLL